MPPLTLHIAIAKELADRLRHPTLEADLGAYYLGSTAPDLRVLTRWERERTHFYDLDDFGEQSGTEAMFRAHPELARSAELNASTAAFLAGYISHLVADEIWIDDIYRPFFGERSALKDDVRAKVMDRVLQYEVDRREKEKTELMRHVRDELRATPLDVRIGFIDMPTLEKWRRISIDVVNHPPDWSRFPLIASRFLSQIGVNTPEELQEFMKQIPGLLTETMNHVGEERVQAFHDRTVRDSLETIREYLS
jgi:hypothetical protein